jgi:alpha-N-acetylglucosaminidase
LNLFLSWGGPLPTDFQAAQYALQQQILARQRSFGMSCVLPAFCGYIPEALAGLNPSANVTSPAPWHHFNQTYGESFLLQPTDPLFYQIGSAFTKLIVQNFGTDRMLSSLFSVVFLLFCFLFVFFR